MARTTISDDLMFIPNKYELGMLAAQRVRDLNGGEAPVVPVGSDRPPVVALREIASGKIDPDVLRGELVQSYKRVPVVDEAEKTLESNAMAPELKELDAELSGDAAISHDIAEELVRESEGAETVAGMESGGGAVEAEE